MARDMAVSTWLDLTGGVPLSWSVSGSDVAHVVVGGGNTVCELVFDAPAMRAMAELSAEATADMEARYTQEVAAESGRHHLHAS